MRRFATIIGLTLLAPFFSACAGTDRSPDGGLAGTQTSAGGIGTSAPAGPNMTAGAGQSAARQDPAVAAVSSDARVQFAPVVGATAEALPPLSSRLSARARQRGIAIVPQGTGATHVVKGYFSAIADGNETTVIYVWDVLDPAGNRLHRIQGQEKVPGSTGDGWSSVTDQTMQAIADRTIDELAAWLPRGTG